MRIPHALLPLVEQKSASPTNTSYSACLPSCFHHRYLLGAIRLKQACSLRMLYEVKVIYVGEDCQDALMWRRNLKENPANLVEFGVSKRWRQARRRCRYVQEVAMENRTLGVWEDQYCVCSCCLIIQCCRCRCCL